jgi:hypothetical protein
MHDITYTFCIYTPHSFVGLHAPSPPLSIYVYSNAPHRLRSLDYTPLTADMTTRSPSPSRLTPSARHVY